MPCRIFNDAASRSRAANGLLTLARQNAFDCTGIALPRSAALHVPCVAPRRLRCSPTPRMVCGWIPTESTARSQSTGRSSLIQAFRTLLQSSKPHQATKPTFFVMEVHDVYTIVLGSIFVVLIGWHLAAVGLWARRKVATWTRKNIAQMVVFRRYQGSTDYTVGSILCIIAIVSGNGVAVFYRTHNGNEFEARLAELSALNLIPIFLAGRTTVFVQHICGLSLRQYSILHRWLGWVCLAQLISLLCLSMSRDHWQIEPIYIAVGLPPCYSKSSLTRIVSIEPCAASSNVAAIYTQALLRDLYQATCAAKCGLVLVLALPYVRFTRPAAGLSCNCPRTLGCSEVTSTLAVVKTQRVHCQS